jgi:hypothetical protein
MLVNHSVASFNVTNREPQVTSCRSVPTRLDKRLVHKSHDEIKSNQHHISDQQRAAVSRRWGWYMDRFGYRAPVRAQTAKSQEKRHSARELIPA